jgi:nucleoside-diphosphate-sugar epimerase
VKVLVAGGAGFIGSHLCARLLADGREVICADNLITGSEANIRPLLANPRFRFERVDVSQPCPFDADAIFNLASPASPVGYMEHPFETIRANSNGTFELLQAARRSGGRFLMASTSEAYGDPLVHPQVETYFGNVNTTGPRACYDESKRLGETITAEFHRQHGVDARIVRIFNTYGPHSQLHDGRMVPNFIVQAVNGEPLTIHGQGQQTRSICYVDDLVEGLLAAMFTPETAGEIFNLGNPEEHTVLDWARMIIRLCESPSPIIFEEKRQDDPERRRPDITKARQRLSWSPSIGPEDGLRRTVEWFRGEIERERSAAPLGAQ